MMGFYPRLDFTLRLKKIITWIFNQVLKRRSRFLFEGLGLDIEGDCFLSLAQSYPRVKEDYYLVFEPSLEERISVFIRGLNPLSLGLGFNPRILKMIGFYPRVGFTLGSKKVITWFFDQVLKKGSQFLSLGSNSHPWDLISTLKSRFLSSGLGWNRLWNPQDMLKFPLSKFLG
jgi:hypothetical protein